MNSKAPVLPTILRGSSMEPALCDGMEITVETDPTAIAVGDIVVVEVEQTLVAHRVIAIDAETVTLRGDNNPQSDPPLPLSAIRGRVVARSGATPLPNALHELTTGHPRVRAALRRAWDSLRKRHTGRFERLTVGAETIVQDRATGDVHSLNATAAWILDEANAGADPARLLQMMLEQHPNVSPERLVADIDETLTALRRLSLLNTDT